MMKKRKGIFPKTYIYLGVMTKPKQKEDIFKTR